MAKFKTKLYQV